MPLVDDDTGTATVPAPRPSAFTPPTVLTPVVNPTTDPTVGTTVITRTNVFDDTSGAVDLPDPDAAIADDEAPLPTGDILGP